ncbi:carbon-nitrogen hydrolase family protein [Oxalobacter sp. OttesenSCG-928-P03]|nr:carbon-nitrogen hydrolase family protein [Oxalobacter sp. OttesenSCG-928-P03]
MTKVAAIQMISTPDVEENIVSARRLIGEAAEQGAKLVLLPEYWPSIGRNDKEKLGQAEEPGSGPIQDFMSGIAREHGIWLIGGTLSLVAPVENKVLNTTLVYDPQGKAVSRYDKIHLFSFASGKEAYDESAYICGGDDVVSFEAPFGRVGLTVCYDLRFPELFRAFGECALIVVPAAFTYTTGKVHWEILLRARAIENQCYILAAAQGGRHQTGRRTWGQTVLIDPWGEIKAELMEGEGVVLGEIEQEVLDTIREKLPALKHKRL